MQREHTFHGRTCLDGRECRRENLSETLANR